MQTFKKILRFRVDDEIVNALHNVSRLSEYVRQAVREKLVNYPPAKDRWASKEQSND